MTNQIANPDVGMRVADGMGSPDNVVPADEVAVLAGTSHATWRLAARCVYSPRMTVKQWPDPLQRAPSRSEYGITTARPASAA